MFLANSPACDRHANETAPSNDAMRERNRGAECFLKSMWRLNRHGTTTERDIQMKRSVKTILMGTAALMAGVGLASAQGMRDAPGSAGDRGASSGSSSEMAPGASGSHRDGAPTRGKKETSGEQPKGKGHIERGQAQRGERSTTGQATSDKEELSKSPQGSKAGDKDGLKTRSRGAEKSGEKKSTTGQATKDQPDSKGSAKKGESTTTGQAPKNERSTTGQGSSDTKASPDSKATSDSKGQTHDPNAARQNQTSGSASQSQSTTGQSNASVRSQAGVQITAQQRTTILQSVLSARNAPRVDRVSFSIHTGTVVPRDVRVVSVTTFPVLIEAFPRYRDYSFFIVEDEVIFVDSGHRIVDVVPIGSRHFGSSSTSTTVAVDLSEPEIREIQTVLIREGFLQGRVSGVFDSRTREALVSFQRKRGFEATGRIDTRTVTALGLEGKVKVKSENSSSSSSSQSSSTTGQSSSGAQKPEQKGTTGQGQSGAQKPDEKSTTGQAGPSPAQKNAVPDKGPSAQKGSNNDRPTPKDQRSSAPARSTTGQGGSDKSPGMSDQNSPGPSQPPAADGQSERPRR
jgi:hypothetical protein